MKKKIAVLHSQVPFVRGGAELMVEALVNNLKLKGYDAEIVGLPFKWYPENSLYDSMLAWRLLDLSESNGEKIDMVIGTKFPSYGAIHDNKVVWLIQQYRQAYDLFGKPFGLKDDKDGRLIRERVSSYDKTAISEAKAVYTISQNVSDRLKLYCGIESKPLYQPPPLVGKYYCDDEQGYICSVGRLDKLKRNDLLIKALKYCNKDVIVKIAGRGPEMDNLKKLANDQGVSDRVEFLGFVPDDKLVDLYARSRAVFFAPVDEDYGFITLEAFFSKKTVITCEDSGGSLEFVRDGENGVVVSPDPKEIADRINELWEDRTKMKIMGEEGYDIVKDISWDNVITKICG